MRITIFAIGSRGDVQPNAALGLGLQRAGHDVGIAALADSEAFVRETGLAYLPIVGNMHETLQTEQGREMLESEGDLRRYMRQLSRILDSYPEAYWKSLVDACEGADAIIYSHTSPHGYHIAEKMGVPSFAVLHTPYIGRTRHFPHPLWPFDLRLGGAYNRMTHLVAEQIMWQPFRKAFNRWRVEMLGLPPVSYAGTYGKMQQNPVLMDHSPSVFPKPPDWGAHIHVTGFWFLDRPHDWQPPDDLLDFLQAGPPPVYVGFGSMNNRDPERVTELVLSALSRAGQRGILATGWGGLSNRDLPDTVFKVAAVPHDWLFPRMAAVVHHAGPNTLATGLRAGRPTVTVPFFGDQPFWGRRVSALGVGPPPIPRQELSDERLAAAITAATCDPAVRQRAQALGRQIQQEHGVKNAVEAFHKHMGV